MFGLFEQAPTKEIEQYRFCKFGYTSTALYPLLNVTQRFSAVCQSSAISISTADTSRRHDASLENSRAIRVRRRTPDNVYNKRAVRLAAKLRHALIGLSDLRDPLLLLAGLARLHNRHTGSR